MSDDGSNLFIDGKLIMDLDGLHSIKKKCGDVVVYTLLESAADTHSVEVEFFKKGKKPTIILEMKWPSESSFSTISKEGWNAMSNVKSCK